MSECRPNDKSLEDILDALVASYDQDWEINNLETWALPNRRSVIEAYHHIQHLLFLGFFSTRSLSRHNLRLSLAEHLLPASEILSAQVRRAAAWEDRKRPPAERRPEGWCTETVTRLLDDLPRLRELLRGDVAAAYAADPAAENIEEIVFSYPGLQAITAYRVAHVLYGLGVPMIPRILTEHAHQRTGIDIHPGARIGRRFFVDHGTGVVVGATCHIGDDVRIYQGVTLGALTVRGDVERRREHVIKRHPTLGDRVTVYAGTTILGGNTTVGDDSVVGGNVWLTRSVPPRSRVFFRPQEPQMETK